MGQSSTHINCGRSAGLLILLVCVLTIQTSFAQNFDPVPGDTVMISQSDFSPDDETIYITNSWKFKAGDSYSWSSPSFSDTSWQKVSTYLGPSELPFIEDWSGIGWFRVHIRVDSSLVSYPLALLIEQHNGASEIYLDGQLLYRLGNVSSFEEDFVPYRDNIPRPLIFKDTKDHVLSVRYANYDAETFNDNGYTAGFRFLIGDLDHHIETSIEGTSFSLWTKMFYAGILLAFTIIHFLLYAFYPTEKRNLFFSLFTGFLALLTYTIIESEYTESPLTVISFYRVSLIAWLMTIIYALRFSYSLFYEKTPRAFWFFFGAGMILAFGTWFEAQSLNLFRQLFVFAALVEIMRVLFVSFFNKREGVWVIGTGLICLVAGILYTVLANLNFFDGDADLGNLFGSAGLIIGMSIYLSKDFARTNKRLQFKLIEVKHLSDRSLQQERINKQKEIERKLLEAENERKSSELEEARTLQLSMLPKEIPDSEYWDIAVFMETAQEVGGDYYDFAFDKEGTMSVALGDATGHGMKAGIMVATAKSYFHTLANEYDLIEMLRRMSSGIRNMNLRMMFISMLFLKCNKHSIQYTSAGMPPVLYYNGKDRSVKRILTKGMPLGSSVDYPYQQKTFDVDPGDTILLMSDGLMELFNEKRELLGIERIEELLANSEGLTAEELLASIKTLADKWAGDKPQEDDITIMVLHARNPELKA